MFHAREAEKLQNIFGESVGGSKSGESNQQLAVSNQPEKAIRSLGARRSDIAQPIFAAFAQPAAVTTESDVAEVVWRAANDATGQLRFPAGADALALAQAR